MNRTETYLEAQRFEKPKSILSARNLVIGVTVFLLLAGAGIFTYTKILKSTHEATEEAKVFTPKKEKSSVASVINSSNPSNPYSHINHINEDANDVHYRSSHNNSTNNSLIARTLCEAISNKNLAHVQSLIEQGEELTDEDFREHDLLNMLVSWGNLEVIELLLGNGLDLNQTCLFDLKKSTFLMLSIEEKRFEVAKFLIEKGADLCILDNFGFSAMDYAIRFDNIKILELILETDPILRLKIDSGDNSIINLANCKKMIDLLKTKSTLDVNQTDSYGKTLLHYTKKREVAKYLISKGADMDAVDKNNFTALHLSIQRRDNEVSKYLIENGANLSVTNCNENTPMDLAISKNQSDIVQLLISKNATLKSDIKFGTLQFSLIGYCIHMNYPETAKVLIDNHVLPTNDDRNRMILMARNDQKWSFISDN